ncbi:protein of unknown function [Legionella fallonii LLAP-10]|uniref:Uncharacterized protein n=1 Tax=Legionella fallonii LLAP-10 TaxID=1212491 RepID=A0A098G713_9GAMM|nr:protein of unknown function [Legionella fallonii LLAP-10]
MRGAFIKHYGTLKADIVLFNCLLAKKDESIYVGGGEQWSTRPRAIQIKI